MQDKQRVTTAVTYDGSELQMTGNQMDTSIMLALAVGQFANSNGMDFSECCKNLEQAYRIYAKKRGTRWLRYE